MHWAQVRGGTSGSCDNRSGRSPPRTFSHRARLRPWQVVGDAVGVADVVGRDVVRNSGNGGGDRPRQVGHRISNLSDKTPPRRRCCWQRRRG